MTELIKQRLVGMLIVVIAGVVFLPDLLDGKKQLTKEEFKKVPARPQIDEQPIVTEFPREEVTAVFKQAPKLASVTPDDASESMSEKPDETSEHHKTNNELSKVNTVTQSVENQPLPADLDDARDETSQEVKAEFTSQAWILQLGSFKHKENVDALRQKLKEAGFDTFTKPVKTKAGLLSKVYIGPEVRKSTLEAAQGKLKELVGIEGKITRFEPTK